MGLQSPLEALLTVQVPVSEVEDARGPAIFLEDQPITVLAQGCLQEILVGRNFDTIEAQARPFPEVAADQTWHGRAMHVAVDHLPLVLRHCGSSSSCLTSYRRSATSAAR